MTSDNLKGNLTGFKLNVDLEYYSDQITIENLERMLKVLLHLEQNGIGYDKVAKEAILEVLAYMGEPQDED